MGLFELVGKAKKKAFVKLVEQTFYAGYPEVPYISEDRPQEWLQRASAFPEQTIIPKAMMKRYADGLLPGHVYMLYWLKKYTEKKVPAYFEYKYGVNFEREVSFLLESGYLDSENKPTAKGEAAIKKHYKVIEEHSVKRGTSRENVVKQIREQRDSIRRNGFTHYEFIASRNSCEVCKQLNGKCFPLSAFKIGATAPPMHDGCSCSIAACEPGAEYEDWLEFIANGGTTAEWQKMKRK